jgi:DNA-binding NtrC family response regulator
MGKKSPSAEGETTMQRQRILVLGLDRDAAYAIRNIFEFERHDIDVCTELDLAREVLVERNYQLIIVDARVCMNEEFDLVDFQLDRGLEAPIIVLGSENTGLRRSLRSRQGLEVVHVDLDGHQLLETVNTWSERETTEVIG